VSTRAAASAALLFACGAPPAPEGPPSVVLITLDTTRADFFRGYG